jgi:hypothetical protein
MAAQTSRGWKVATIVLGAMLLTVIIVGSVLLYGMLHADDRVALEDPEAAIVTAYGGSMFSLTRTSTDGTATVVCDAFAVRADLLATTGHCLGFLEDRGTANDALSVRRAGLPQVELEITGMWRHPHYSKDASGPTADVGILQVASPLTVAAPLAGMKALEISPDTPLYVLSSSEPSEQPVVLTTHLLGMDPLQGPSGTSEKKVFRHDTAAAAPSGAPVFDAYGQVVAIYIAEGTTPYSIRIDLLTSLLAGLP